jgi:hypothetical protein
MRIVFKNSGEKVFFLENQIRRETDITVVDTDFIFFPRNGVNPVLFHQRVQGLGCLWAIKNSSCISNMKRSGPPCEEIMSYRSSLQHPLSSRSKPPSMKITKVAFD